MIFVYIIHIVPNNNIIILNIESEYLKQFITRLAEVIEKIKESSGKVMLPIAIQPSPLDIEKEIIIVFKETNDLEDFYFQGLKIDTINIPQLAKRFVLKQHEFKNIEDSQDMNN
jgi:hypothetical protein